MGNIANTEQVMNICKAIEPVPCGPISFLLPGSAGEWHATTWTSGGKNMAIFAIHFFTNSTSVRKPN